MGLFDFFRNKKKETPKTTPSPQEETVEKTGTPEPEDIITVEQVTEGSHGDHWAGIFGFGNWYENQKFPTEMLAFIAAFSTEQSTIDNMTLKEYALPYFRLKSMYHGKDMVTTFPIIKSTQSIPFQTKNIKEWAHVNGIEAQISGSGKATFGVSFFANDYFENKERYHNDAHVNVNLSGIILGVGAAPQMEGMSDEFVGYFPNKEHGQFSIIDFVGKVLALEAADSHELPIEGYWMKLRLINHEEDANFFVIDAFLSKNNSSLPSIQIGDRISGAMWIQGELA
jgi:hypothetical protein